MNREDRNIKLWEGNILPSFNHEKKEILPFAITWLDLEGIMLSEISQTEKKKYCMLSLICGI